MEQEHDTTVFNSERLEALHNELKAFISEFTDRKLYGKNSVNLLNNIERHVMDAAQHLVWQNYMTTEFPVEIKQQHRYSRKHTISNEDVAI